MNRGKSALSRKESAMELKLRKHKDTYIIDVIGEMDLYNAYKLKEIVIRMLEKGIKRFVVNLEQVGYIDSSGIGALIFVCSTIRKRNLRFIISNIHGSVKKVIELTKLMGYFPIAGTLEEAIRQIEAPGVKTA
jgi:anti-sigma B factor antagonist